MATMDEKKVRQLRLFNTIIAGFAEGLYDLFGDSATATMDSIGLEICHEMMHELGLEIGDEPPQAIIAEIERVLVDEYGLTTSSEITFDAASHKSSLTCENCVLMKACKDLQEANIPPYSCVPAAMITAVLHKRFGKRLKLTARDLDFEKRICRISGTLLD